MRDKTQVITYKNEETEFHLQFTQLVPSKSLKFMMYVGKILGGSAGKLIGSLGTDSIKNLSEMKEKDFNLEKIGDSLFGIFDRLDDDAFIEKLNLLFGSVTNEGQVLNVDHLLFQGQPMLIFKVARKALEVNYGNFLDENSGVIGKLLKSIKMIASSKDSQKTQT